MITYKVKLGSHVSNLYLPEKSSGRIVLLIPGLPTANNTSKLLETFLEYGCTVFYPSLSGSFDSSGDFNPEHHISNIRTLIKYIKKGSFKELYFGKELSVDINSELILVGMSYGASIALLGEKDSGADKLILLSPVLLFRQKDISDIVEFNFSSHMKNLVSLLKNAFPFSYRPISYNKLKSFLFGKVPILSHTSIKKTIENISVPTLIIHGKRDTSVPYQVSESLSKNVNNTNIKWVFDETSGHSSSSYSKKIFSGIVKFLTS